MPLLAFLVTVGYFPGIPSASSSPRWWIIFVGAFALLALQGWQGERGRITLGHWLFAAVWMCGALTWFWSVSVEDTTGELMRLLSLGVVFHLAAQMKDTRGLWIAMGLGLIPSLVVSVMQMTGWNPVQTATPIPTGLFLNRNTMAEIAGIVFLALVGFAFQKRSTSTLVYLALMCGWLALVPHSRAVWLSLVGVGAVYVVTYPTRARSLVLAGGVCALGVAVAWQLHDPSRLGSLEARWDIWALTLKNLKVFGWGFGAYGTVFDFEYAHNELLHYGFELGVLVLPLMALGLYVIGGELVSERLAILGLAIQSAFSFPLHTPATAFAACVAAGALCGLRARACDPKLAGGTTGDADFRPSGYGIPYGNLYRPAASRTDIPL